MRTQSALSKTCRLLGKAESVGVGAFSSDFLFALQPPPPSPIPTNPPGRPTPESLISVHFGSVSALFGSVWLRFGSVSAPFRLRFGVLGGVGVGLGRGASVREKNITSLFPSSNRLKQFLQLMQRPVARRALFGFQGKG